MRSSPAFSGDTLKINYSIDPKVTGTVTFRTMSPIPKSDLLGLLEDMLALSGAAMVPRGGGYDIIPAGPGIQDAGDPSGDQREDRLRSGLRHPHHPGAFRLARQPEIRRRAAAAAGPAAVHRRPASSADVCRHEQRSRGRGRSHLHPRCRSHGRQILRPLPGQIFRSHGGGERAAHDPGPGRQRGGRQSHRGRARRPDERHSGDHLPARLSRPGPRMDQPARPWRRDDAAPPLCPLCAERPRGGARPGAAPGPRHFRRRIAGGLQPRRARHGPEHGQRPGHGRRPRRRLRRRPRRRDADLGRQCCRGTLGSEQQRGDRPGQPGEPGRLPGHRRLCRPGARQCHRRHRLERHRLERYRRRRHRCQWRRARISCGSCRTAATTP